MEHNMIADLESALSALDANSYEQWVDAGYALYPAGNDGRRLWLAWSSTGVGYNERDAMQKWRSFRNSRSDPKAIFTYARKAGWNPSRTPHKPFSARPLTQPPPSPQPRSDKPNEHLAWLWNGSLPLDHPNAEPARRYLDHRELGSILQDLPENVQFHPQLSYRDDEQGVTHHPAILARIEDAGGQLVGVHRTYLTSDGRKADVPEPKKILGKMPPGAAIRLYPWRPGHPMAIAEGLETALAIRIADFPANVWCGVTAHGMASFTPPEGVSQLTVYADRDRSEAGIKAARKLQQRMTAAGVPCRVLEPSDEQCREVFALRGPLKSVDWLDVLSARGEL